MNKSYLLITVCACFFVFVTSSTAWAAPVTVTLSGLNALVNDDGSGSSGDFSGSTAIPTTETLTATSGNSSNITNIIYSGDVGSATFSVDMSHSIDNTDGLSTFGLLDYAQTVNNFFEFTANIDAIYSVSGFYNMLGPAGTTTFLDVLLEDKTTGTSLFQDLTESNSTENESFVLGNIGDGDSSNTNSGFLTGNLIAGHEYKFLFKSLIRSLDGNGQESLVAATGTGNVTLNIATVPVPATVWLFGSGLIGLIGIAKRKKAA